jgi:hypothetical protein
MDWFYVGATIVIGGAIVAYTLYKDWQLRRENVSKTLRIERGIGNIVGAIEKFDKMADAHYGEGSVPEHINNVRDDLERGYRLLTGDDE